VSSNFVELVGKNIEPIKINSNQARLEAAI